MLGMLFHDAMLAARAKTGAGGALFVWAGIVVISALAGITFLAVAAYAWLAYTYEPVTAGLVLAGFFAGIAVIAAIVCVVVKRRTAARAKAKLAAEASSLLFDPRMLVAGFEVLRMLGWRKIAPLALVALLAAGISRERSRASEPAE
jgi:hypothetical protein